MLHNVSINMRAHISSYWVWDARGKDNVSRGRARSETKGLYSQVNKLNNYDTKLRTFLIFLGLFLCRLSVEIDGLSRVYVRRAELE